MEIFIYYPKNQTTQEPLSKFNAESMEEAIMIAASKKRMKIEDFLNLFVVESVDS